MMERIWAPWRIAYIRNGRSKKDKGCLFCRVKKEDKKRKENYLLKKGKFSLVLLNLYPYNNGHLLFAPLRHISKLSQLSKEEREEIFFLVNRSIEALNKIIKPDGYNLGMNLGKIAGAGVPGHIHFHLVPRWTGDTNFFPVVSETKVISQSLSELYQKLLPFFKE